MTTETYECENRRAEITGTVVAFLRVTGNVRKSFSAVFWNDYEDVKKARRLARRWAFKGLLGKAVL